MKTSRLATGGRAFLVVAALGLTLAAALAAGWKGVVLDWGGLRISARAPRNPLLLALTCAVIGWALGPRGGRTAAVAAECSGLARTVSRAVSSVLRSVEAAAARLGPTLAAVAAVAVVVVGFREGAPIAAGSDSYGYVSQAHLWATGKLKVEPPLLHELPPVVSPKALAPLGYNISADGATLVPSYAPGLPIVMSVFERIAGRRAVFWVVPILGGLAVGSAYLLGRIAAGPLGGAFTSILVASSPAFLFQLTSPPMSDLPAAAWWTLALALLFSASRLGALGAGLAAGIAILTRPNLVPLLVVPGAYLLWRAIRERRSQRSEPRPPSGLVEGEPSAAAARRLWWFAAGAIPFCFAVAAVHTHLFGSPFRSGYDVRALFALEHAWPNLARYPVLASEMHTPLLWLALAAPVLHWRRRPGAAPPLPARSVVLLATCFVLAVLGCYLFYPAFDAYWRLRFLLPAIPALLALTTAALMSAASRLPPPCRIVSTALVTAVVAYHGVTYAGARAAFATEGEWKYALIGEHIASRLPERAVFLAMQHSGSVRYYSGRAMVRYDFIPRRRLDHVIEGLRRRGYRPYFLLEPWEEPVFRQRFRQRSLLGLLDWPPAVELQFAGVRIYDPADRDTSLAGDQRVTEIVPWPFPLP